MPRRTSVVAFITLVCLVAAASLPVAMARGPEATSARSLGRVLITNDDGIDSPGLHALAAAFAEVADEVIVVAPAGEASGSGMRTNALLQRRLEVRKVSIPHDIPAYAVEGFPGDAVLFGCEVAFGSERPDLVVSGINTGPNLGPAYLFSGTIGAARLARLTGFPAIAVSGGRDDVPGQLEAAARYTVALAQSRAFASLEPDQYLTLSVPIIEPSQWAGVQVAPREVSGFYFSFAEDAVPPDENGHTYELDARRSPPPAPDSDVALFGQRHLIIVPMTLTEHLTDMIDEWQRLPNTLPSLDAASR